MGATKGAKAANASFVLQKVQPALLGLMDGSVSTLAPLFATAGLTHQAHKAFFVGLAAVGAGVALHVAYMVVGVELVAIAMIRYRFMKSPLWSTIVQVIIGGGIVFLIGVLLGNWGVSET